MTAVEALDPVLAEGDVVERIVKSWMVRLVNSARRCEICGPMGRDGDGICATSAGESGGVDVAAVMAISEVGLRAKKRGVLVSAPRDVVR